MTTTGEAERNQAIAGSADAEPRSGRLPGFTAAGLGSAEQLLAKTSSVSFTVDQTTAQRGLFVLPTALVGPAGSPTLTPLKAEEYPVLAAIWDNEEDDIFDSI